MRKIILSLMAVIGMVLFSGCMTRMTPELNYDGIKYRIYHDFNAPNAYDIKFVDRKATWYRDVGIDKALKLNLKIAAIETKRKGYNYFVLTNDGINNFNGFPINTYSELLRYITLKKRKDSFATSGANQGRGKWRLVDHGHVHVGFMPVGDEYKNSYISVWSVEQTLRDTK